MKILIVLAIVAAAAISLLAADQYYLSLQDRELKKSDWVQDCVPVESDAIIPSIGLFNHTHSFDLKTCTWSPVKHGTPGFLESLYISFIEPVFSDVAGRLEIRYAHAICIAPPSGLPKPCFDSYLKSRGMVTEGYIMNHIYEYIDANYDVWQVSDREWSDDDDDTVLDLPAIICTEFVVDDRTEYRMLRWVNSDTISNLENHRNDLLCDRWLPPTNGSLPACDPNPKHDFGECEREYSASSDAALQRVLDHCKQQQKHVGGPDVHYQWHNATHYTDNADCEFSDRTIGSTTYGLPFDSNGTAGPKEPYTDSDNLCPPGKVLEWDICVDACPIGQTARNGICQSFEHVKIIPNVGRFDLTPIFIIFGIPVVLVSAFAVWRKKRR